MKRKAELLEFPSPLGVIFSLIYYQLSHNLSYYYYVSVSSRSYILSYDEIVNCYKMLTCERFRLLSELYSLL